MAHESKQWNETFEASADLSAAQYKAVVLDSNGQTAVVAAAGGPVLGIQQDKPSALGMATEVTLLGKSKVLAGTGGIAKGDMVKAAADGRIVKVTSAATGLGATKTDDAGVPLDPLIGSFILGYCLDAAAAGEIGTIVFNPVGVVATTAA